MKILPGIMIRTSFLLVLLSFISPIKSDCKSKPLNQQVLMGAERMDEYLPMLKGKTIGLVVNHTSLVGPYFKKVHLLDSLLALQVNVKKIFCPEHGFRGTASAGENIESGIDQKTGLPIISLYGNHKKPLPEDLEGLDVVIFDIQDVGARFYTYISTMHYVMEACAENSKNVIIMDRPNPNGFYVDGPVLEPEFKSFVGMHPVPIVHGMTVGEYALMINGEGWLEGGKKCNLSVVPCGNYNHNVFYRVRTNPSPNLPNMTAIYLYPSLCLFEGTIMSVGRGTEKPFQIFGHPDFKNMGYTFTPMANEGAKNPKYEGIECHGVDLSTLRKDDFRQVENIKLEWLLDCYQKFKGKEEFFNSFFEKLAGTDKLREQIQNGLTEEEIRYSWQRDLEAFHKIRKKYLLYQDYR